MSANRLRLAEMLRRTALKNLGRPRQGHVSTITGKVMPTEPDPKMAALAAQLRQVAASLTSNGQIHTVLYAADLIEQSAQQPKGGRHG